MFALHGNFAFCQGFPGAGKTQVLTLQAAFLVLMGRSVLLLGPTNESTDNLIEKFVKLLQELGMDELNIDDVKPIRVYRPMQERSAAERSSIDENAEEEKPLVGENAVSEGEKEKPLVEYTEDAELEGGVPLLEPELAVKAENQLADLVSTMKCQISGKNFNLPLYSLQARVHEFATGAEGNFELWGKWKGRNTDVPESRLYSADSGAPENTAESAANNEGTEAIDIELLGLIRHNLERAVTEPVKTWPQRRHEPHPKGV